MKKRIAIHNEFVLLFEINKRNSKYLKQIEKLSIQNDNFSGIVFQIKSDLFSYITLSFFKEIIDKLIWADKKITFLGIPECVPRTIFGGYTYMRLMQNRIPGIQYAEDSEGDGNNSVFLPECEGCMYRPGCVGISKNNVDIFKPVVKMERPNSQGTKENLFGGSSELSSLHDAFVNHCSQVRSSVADRYIYYASSIDYGSIHSYSDRFIYQCDFLPPSEYNKEFNFLKKKCKYPFYVNLIRSVANINKTCQIGYSIAHKSNIFRESFYMSSPKEYGIRLLGDFDVSCHLPRSRDLQFRGIGIDIINNNIHSYKIYYISNINFILSYLIELEIDVHILKNKMNYFVVRLDKNQQIISYKIELKMSFDDFYLFQGHIKKEYYNKNFIEKLGVVTISIEFENDIVNKINIYHHKPFPEKQSNEL